MTPRLIFDMDGTITDGRHLTWPQGSLAEVKAAYQALPPYDKDTPRVWNELAGRYDLVILTWRSFDRASDDIKQWLMSHHMIQPDAILTCLPYEEGYDFKQWKVDIAKLLRPQAFFDDHPGIIERAEKCGLRDCYLMDNKYNPENQRANGLVRVHSWAEIGRNF